MGKKVTLHEVIRDILEREGRRMMTTSELIDRIDYRRLLRALTNSRHQSNLVKRSFRIHSRASDVALHEPEICVFVQPSLACLG